MQRPYRHEDNIADGGGLDLKEVSNYLDSLKTNATDFSIFVGPQIGINVYKSVNLSIDREPVIFTEKPIESDVTPIDIALVVGVQYALKWQFLLSARYNIGFTTTSKPRQGGRNKTIEGDYNRVLQIGIGYQF